MAEFSRRVLVVDADVAFADAAASRLKEAGYEVLRAQDGFEALVALRGAKPELLVTELSLPRMSGFELLSVVRTRFPEISVIAVSNEFVWSMEAPGTLADAFVRKEPNATFELVEIARQLSERSPLRGSHPKEGLVWVPQSRSGYLVLTCPECLRSFSVHAPWQAGRARAQEDCIYCGAKIAFEWSPPLAEEPQLSGEERGRLLIESSRKLIRSSHERLERGTPGKAFGEK